MFEGDISSNRVVFDGSNTVFDDTASATDKVFTTTLSESFISSKDAVSSMLEPDELLISRGSSLKKISKENFWKSIHRTPVGTVVAYMGQTAPVGWLLCDGSEVLQTEFQALFTVIGYTFGASSNLVGIPGQTFKLPDLRGRFALGLDNMNNGITVPSATNPAVSVSTGGGTANRVTDPRASELGIGAGSEDVIIDVEHLPDHEHDMRSAEDNQYYAYRDIAGDPTDTGAVSGSGSTDANLGQYLATSGGVASNTLNIPLDILNPFLATNYIIYTGTDV
jgi:microcystin-dependent protein